uniref:NADH-ubiquinone oxidoreductase chain 4 n=1 Tax=Sirodotia delicatula TaxID=386631 RepID=A0A343UY35_9FLOR|nr:NADH dehydrogenase subunit 4 [Sirodotia delicatula]AVK39592.1 NADH dehydrogenase subunit 4 [Sirodotia delicatula]
MENLNILVLTAFTPLLGVVFLLLIPEKHSTLCSNFAFFISCLTFLLSLLLWIEFDSGSSTFQCLHTVDWLSLFNFYYVIGIDGVSLFFIILTTFLIMICVLVSWGSVNYRIKDYLICFLLLEFLLIQVFSVLDLLLFYIFFESVLMPMFLIVGVWGSRERKIRAAYQFFLYTLIGSILMLLGILIVYFQAGTTDLQILWNLEFSERKQLILWLSFFLSFAVKIPMMPFHIWLPEAHAEAPTSGSVILAGILLKMGAYGFLRFSLPMFPLATIFFTPLVFVLSLIAAVYASLTTLRQVDLKKIVAYSSISHMGFVTIGIFTLNIQGLEGSIFLMLSHGLVSSALFLCIGILYDRYHTRIIKYYNGFVKVMPIFSLFFLFFSFANIGFPGTSSFVGELLVLLGAFQSSVILVLCISFSIVLSAAYSIWMFNRIMFGTLKLEYTDTFQDISRREFVILFSITFLVFWMGLYPESFLKEMHSSIFNLLEQVNYIKK